MVSVVELASFWDPHFVAAVGFKSWLGAVPTRNDGMRVLRATVIRMLVSLSVCAFFGAGANCKVLLLQKKTHV